MKGLEGLLIAALWSGLAGAASAGAPVQSLTAAAPDPIDKVRARLLEARHVTASAACGSAMAPWAYRGPRGTRMTLAAYSRREQDQAWNAEFVAALLQPADWDSSSNFRGVSKPCDETHRVPLFTVTWQAGGSGAMLDQVETYALLSFEARSVVLFEAGRPMGTVWMRARADTLFAMIRRALPEDSLLQAADTPVATPARPDESTRIVAPIGVLPEVLEKAKPRYPEEARRAGVEGTVFVRALVGTNGAVRDAFAVGGAGTPPMLEGPAVDAVWDWRFRPAQDPDGIPVAVWVAVPIRFTLR